MHQGFYDNSQSKVSELATQEKWQPAKNSAVLSMNSLEKTGSVSSGAVNAKAPVD